MSMKDLNEKLAVEVMGFHKVKHLWYSCPNPVRSTEPEYSTVDTVSDQLDTWNPTTDLNQLRECYLALSQEQKAVYKQLVIDHDVQSVFDVPEQHAELILKAKGVEV